MFIKALIAADWTGDLEGHLDAVENLLPIFHGCNSINYLHYVTFYLESMWIKRNFNVAGGRDISLAQVMEHDLLSTNILFNGGHTSNPTTNQSLFKSWKSILKVENWTLRIHWPSNCIARQFYVNDSANVAKRTGCFWRIVYSNMEEGQIHQPISGTALDFW